MKLCGSIMKRMIHFVWGITSQNQDTVLLLKHL